LPKIAGFAPEKIGEGFPETKHAYETSTYGTHIHGNIPYLCWRISEIRFGDKKKSFVKQQLPILPCTNRQSFSAEVTVLKSQHTEVESLPVD